MFNEKKILAVIISSVLGILILFSALIYNTNRFIDNNNNLLFVVSQIGHDITNSHILLGEVLHNEHNDVENINSSFQEIKTLSQTILQGGQYKDVVLTPESNQQIISMVKNIDKEAKELYNLSQNVDSLANSQDIYSEYEKYYHSLAQQVKELERYILYDNDAKVVHFKTFQYTIFALVIFFGGFSLLVVRGYDKNRQKLLEETQINSNKFLTLFNSSLDAVILMEENRFIDCNDSTIKMFGYSKDELLKFTATNLLTEQQFDGRGGVETSTQILDDVMEKGQCRYKLYYRTSNDSNFFGDTFITKTEINNRVYLQVIIRDITQEIENDRLLVHQSKKAAMGEMLGAIAHQLAQPINTISIISQELEEFIINDSVLKAEIDEASKHINNSVILMHETINDFRNFLRPNKDKTTFSVNDCVTKVKDFVGKSFQESNITLTFKNNFEKDHIIKGIPSELQQVILSILNNARDVINEKKPTIREVLVELNEGSRVFKIVISDSGGGVPHSLKSEIFNPYFTTKGEKGTGIGLFIAQKIITEKFNGNISIDNNNLGAVFTITLGKQG